MCKFVKLFYEYFVPLKCKYLFMEGWKYFMVVWRPEKTFEILNHDQIAQTLSIKMKRCKQIKLDLGIIIRASKLLAAIQYSILYQKNIQYTVYVVWFWLMSHTVCFFFNFTCKSVTVWFLRFSLTCQEPGLKVAYFRYSMWTEENKGTEVCQMADFGYARLSENFDAASDLLRASWLYWHSRN